MPYKVSGTTVMVEKDGKWKVLKKHPTRAKALAHMKALYANVKEAK